MEIIKPDGKLDADVIDEILRVKERTARSRERRDWAAISASALGVVLLAAAIATAAMSGGSSEGASPAPLVMVAVGGLLAVVGVVVLVLSFRADAQAFLSGGGQTGVERHYRNVYPEEFAEAERREKAVARRRAQEAALRKSAGALGASRRAIARERSRGKRGGDK